MHDRAPSRADLAPRPGRARVHRVAMGLFMAWTALVALGSMGKPLQPVQDLRVVLTRPYERLLGTHQTWTMFASNPPRSTSWLRAYGRSEGGRSTRIDVLVGPVEPDHVEWIYNRAGKMERNVLDEDREALQQSWASWACRREEAAGVRYARITLEEIKRRIPPPEERGQLPREQWETTFKRLDRLPCPWTAQ